MTSLTLFSRMALAVLAFVFTATAVHAEAPGKPVEFGARVVENGTMVKLTWMANRDGGEPTMFCIFIADGETENEADFELLKEDDFTAVQNLYSYLVQDLEPGTYTFFIKAKNDDGTSERSIIRVVTLEEPPSGKPGKPVEFSAKVVEEGTMVKLIWQTNREGGAPSAFCIYIAEGETEDMDDFTLLAEVEASPTSMIHDYLVKDLEPGTYTFYVIAKNDDGTSERSVIRVVVLGETNKEARIEIVGQKAYGLKAGTAWEQKLKYEANFDPTSVSWAISEGPDGLEINEETGVLSWNDPQKGRYEVVVTLTATTPDGETVTTTKVIVIEVGDGEDNEEKKKCASIVGTVKGDGGDGAPAMSGWVYAWSMEQLGNSEKVRERVYKAQIRQGTYVIEVPAGTYRLQVEGEGFYSEWYEDAENADGATEVTVECNNRAEANFLVKYRPEPEMKTVCGTVYDAENNEPIKNALVVFEVREDRENKPNGRYKRLVAESDADGKYCLEVPAGYTYIATATARTPNAKEDMYLREYYDNTHDASQATGITVEENMDGIDFPMDKKPTYEGGFGGTMMDDETEAGIPGKVIAYMIHDGENGKGEGKVRIQTVETDENGNYEFTGLEPGTYIVMGLPGERPYAPGWHTTTGPAAASWKDASEIEVNDIMLTIQHDIRLDKVTDNVGRGHLKGWVKHRSGTIRKDGGRVQADAPVAGAMVYAYDAANTLVDAAMTADDGSYVLTNLPLGQTLLAIDRIEFQPTAEYPEITTDDLSQERTTTIQQIVTNVEVPIDRIGTDLNLYPNPTNGSATLAFQAVDGTARVQIISMAGTILSSETHMVVSGQTSLDLRTETLPSGMVMVHVTNGTTSFALPLQIVR